MLGVIVNVATVLVGSFIGLIFKKGISKKFSDAVMTGIGLCTILIGVQGMLKGENVLVAIVSMVLGAIAGTALNIDGRLICNTEREYDTGLCVLNYLIGEICPPHKK